MAEPKANASRATSAEPEAVGLLLLAAGASTRMGRPKQLLPYRGRTLLRHAAETAAASGCTPRLLVTGALHAELLPEIDGLDFYVHRNPDWATGMGSSVVAGLQALEARHPYLAAVVVMLCDQPLLSAQVLQGLQQQFLSSGQAVVASAYAGTRGVPALFARSVFDELRALAGAAGARHLLQRYAHLPAVGFASGVVDVDTVEDYAAL